MLLGNVQGYGQYPWQPLLCVFEIFRFLEKLVLPRGRGVNVQILCKNNGERKLDILPRIWLKHPRLLISKSSLSGKRGGKTKNKLNKIIWSILFEKIQVNWVFLLRAAARKNFVSNDIFACVTLWFVKRKCYIWKLLTGPGKAMCHTYDSHLVEYINLLCAGKRTQVFH